MNRLLSFFIVLGGLLAFCGCSEVPVLEPPITDTPSQIYQADMDTVWRALQLTMRRYPIRTNNIDEGTLETDYVSGDKIFSDPGDHRNIPYRYKIVVRAVKGKDGPKPAVKVTVLKMAEIQHNFFDGYEPFPSNGLEQQMILYRTQRNIEIDHLLTKYAH